MLSKADWAPKSSLLLRVWSDKWQQKWCGERTAVGRQAGKDCVKEEEREEEKENVFLEAEGPQISNRNSSMVFWALRDEATEGSS